jgi:ribosomal protein S12 methylthiotransferase accessory factor
VNAVLEVTLDEDLELEHFIGNFNRMFGKEVMDNVVGSVNGTVRFYGLSKTSMNLEGIEPHLRLIESYKKLHQARKANLSI